MAERLRIGIVCGDRKPELFHDRLAAQAPWSIEFIPAASVPGGPQAVRPDFLAVLFPREGRFQGLNEILARRFPGAELIGYLNSSAPSSGIQRTDDGLLFVHLPMNYALAEHLFENLSRISAYRSEVALARQREGNTREFFDSFMDLVESTWNADHRKHAMKALMDKLLARLQAEVCSVYLYAEGGSGLDRVYSTGSPAEMDLFDHQLNAPLVEAVVSTGAPRVHNDFAFEIQVPFSGESFAVRSLLCMALKRKGATIGAIEILNRKSGGFTAADEELVRMLVEPIAVAVTTVRMFDSSERLSITDDLTNLYNHRYLMQYLETEVRRCLRYKKKVSLLFMDIDGFKRINDTYGHMVGSRAISELGRLLRSLLRDTDIVGRYGGDEFIVILPETPLNGALVIAERIRKNVEDYDFLVHEKSVQLTVSVGVANCPKHTYTAEGLIKKADAAMYRAKALSKNTIKVAV